MCCSCMWKSPMWGCWHLAKWPAWREVMSVLVCWLSSSPHASNHALGVAWEAAQPLRAPTSTGSASPVRGKYLLWSICCQPAWQYLQEAARITLHFVGGYRGWDGWDLRQSFCPWGLHQLTGCEHLLIAISSMHGAGRPPLKPLAAPVALQVRMSKVLLKVSTWGSL